MNQAGKKNQGENNLPARTEGEPAYTIKLRAFRFPRRHCTVHADPPRLPATLLTPMTKRGGGGGINNAFGDW